jgi:hypothetical protein
METIHKGENDLRPEVSLQIMAEIQQLCAGCFPSHASNKFPALVQEGSQGVSVKLTARSLRSQPDGRLDKERSLAAGTARLLSEGAGQMRIYSST